MVICNNVLSIKEFIRRNFLTDSISISFSNVKNSSFSHSITLNFLQYMRHKQIETQMKCANPIVQKQKSKDEGSNQC